MNTKLIKIKDLATEGLQVRCEINEAAVSDYAEAMSDGAEFPPIIVFGDGTRYYLADGFHRVASAKRLQREEISATVYEGGFADALRYALGANTLHGLRRTNADKQRALEIAWERRNIVIPDPKGEDESGTPTGLPSSRQLASVCGVSHELAHQFVQKSGVSRIDTPSGKSVKANLADGKDRFGVMIPPALLPAFQSAPLRKLLRDVRKSKDALSKRLEAGDAAFAAVPQQALINLDNAARELKFAEAYCVCRGCAGEGCYRCGDRGFQTLMQYKQMPEDYRDQGSGIRD